MVFFGYKTVRAGDHAVVWSRDGSFKVIAGPKRVTLYRQRLEMLPVYTADQNSYLEIRKCTGVVEIIPGPSSKFIEPVVDESIRVLQCTMIAASEALVVSRQNSASQDKSKDTNGVDVRIIRGPARFIPEAGEWIDRKLNEYVADQKSYLEIRKRTGIKEIMPGPCSTFLDPVLDESITVLEAKTIGASQALVINRRRSVSEAKGTSNDVEVRLVMGPVQFIPSADEWVQDVLREYTADQNSYLEVRKRAGPVEILHGPTSMFLDPVADESIRVLSATMIDASEALVVYRHSSGSSSQVERKIVRGPARFIPAANEWVHQFEWSGMPKDGSKTSYQPKVLKFSKLKVIPTTAYHNVNEVRTNDDTLITVKLMLFFELIDIEKMLDATPDPIGDFINAASSDVIAFMSAISYEAFLNETYQLNDLGTFKQLAARAEHIGYKMEKVVFRGFQAGEKLQAMHDNAIQERTRLRLLEETQAQEQRATDLRLSAEAQRAAKEAELKIEQARLAAEISLSQQKAKLAEQALVDQAEQDRARQKLEAELHASREQGNATIEIETRKLEVEQARNVEQLRMMKEMKSLNVDITKVLVSQHQTPDNLIRLETLGGATKENLTHADAGKKGLLGALQLNL